MELSTPKKSKKHQSHLLLSGSTLSTHYNLTHCGMWLKASHACRWMWDGASRSSLKTNVVMWLHVWTHTVIGMPCMHAYCTTLIPPPPAHAITCAPTLHFPVCCRRLSPSCCQTPGHLWNSPHRSHLTPALEGNKSGRNWWVTGVPDSRLV